MRGTRFTLLVATVALAVTAFPAHASSDAPDRVTFGGTDCLDMRLFVTTPASRFDGIVPSKFKIETSATGQAVVFLSFTSCRHPSLNGQVFSNPHSMSDVGVFIDSPDGSEGIHYFQLMSGVSGENHWYALREFGTSAAYHNHNYQTVGPTVTMTGSVHPLHGQEQSNIGPYSIGAVGAKFSAPHELRYVGWTVWKERTIAVEKHVHMSASGFAQGRLHVNEDTPLAGFVSTGEYPTLLGSLSFSGLASTRYI